MSIVLVIIVVGIQFIPTTLNQSSDIPKADLIRTYKMTDDLALIFKTSCYDCHSNQTDYPWYNKVQPFAWVLEKHIREGKKELNFSEWDDYSDRRKKSKLKSMISQIKGDEMPLKSYFIMHKNARLSKNKKLKALEFLEDLKDSLE